MTAAWANRGRRVYGWWSGSRHYVLGRRRVAACGLAAARGGRETEVGFLRLLVVSPG
jgi:hypothetical protein